VPLRQKPSALLDTRVVYCSGNLEQKIDCHLFPCPGPWQPRPKIGQNRESHSDARCVIISCIENVANVTKPRRKRSLSAHQKQIRFLTVMAVVLGLAVFVGLIFFD
jgi:hypothetical protein